MLPDAKPCNILMVGKSGIGATTMMEALSYITKTYYIQDMTGNSMTEFVKMKHEKKINILLYADFNKTLNRKRSTTDLTLSTMLNITWDGVTNLHQNVTKILEFPDPVYLSMITKMTKDMYNKQLPNLNSLGLTQRFLPLSWNYPQDVWKTIRKNKYNMPTNKDKMRFTIPYPIDKIKIIWDEDEMRFNMIPITDLIISQNNDFQQSRYDEMLIQIAKGLAVYYYMCDNKIRKNRKTTIHIDDRTYKKIAFLQQYMNTRENEIKPSGELIHPKFRF